ncbi:MAG: retropepsin-like domain-containing protein [Pyrinomonadaceae bacterium]|nr:retropepsin-like domain-containing protein [Pyrinomonadaceae bacterium]
MIHQIDFSHLIKYDTGLNGISFDVEISLIDVSTKLTAKIDTGSTDCIFSRKYGEQIGLEIENGEFVRIGTAVGGFSTYRQFVTLSFLDLSYDAGICFALDESFNRNILGRNWFLNQVLLGLNDYEGKLYLRSLAETWQ